MADHAGEFLDGVRELKKKKDKADGDPDPEQEEARGQAEMMAAQLRLLKGKRQQAPNGDARAPQEEAPVKEEDVSDGGDAPSQPSDGGRGDDDNEEGEDDQKGTARTGGGAPSPPSHEDDESPKGKDKEEDDHYMIDRWGNIVPIEKRRGVDESSGDAEEKRWMGKLEVNRKVLRRDTDRELKWLAMTEDWNAFLESNPKKVKSRVRKGIPDSLRGLVWPLLCGARDRRDQFPHMYEQLSQQRADKEVEIQIKKDKKRTMQNHVHYRSLNPSDGDLDAEQGLGQSALFRVLKAYAIHNPRIGYCQGMSSPAAMFTLYMPEDEAFWMLDRVLGDAKYERFGRVYEDGFPLLFQFLYVHERLLERRMKKVARHLEAEMVPTTLYATRWFSTVFSQFPTGVVLRLWDIFLHEGTKILFRMALFLLKRVEKQILAGDMETIATLLQSMQDDAYFRDEDAVIADVLKVSLSRKEIADLTRQYHELKVKT